MSRLHEKFIILRQSGRKALIPYLTAGDPNLQMTYEFALECIAAGADVLELGIPFSDPMADGPTIQSAAHRALLAGTKVADIFATVKRIRAFNDIPIVFLVYYNTICRRGEQNFISACADSGVDGLVIPDLPVEESGSIRSLASENGIDIIQLIAPASTMDRITDAAKVASGFIYCVSRNGVTGARESLHTELSRFLVDVRSCTEVPLVVGFGISQPEHARQAAEQADGVIVGSALIAAVDEAFQKDGEIAAISVVRSFLIPFRQALDHTVTV